ncbi:elongation factor P maturation arginine rhamnosyltransferase EarP [Parashewanella spongiae]|uniref:Protein-arginine rhamnosyltransferase n=1 Tax=Parashewanella spongiae TaxID=342950 RepID=A0A3A6U9M7_9GAMM|nr:elongation factor P maturation arginine rhamnosyltransferase EarP [Parashewanella spongiae]MCL1077497.1 elongation factor P maturation arginine rhamnosyltransferase EarP [Parashewanella spongiae]RJY18646.1 elongation factor P maturation arginine rhamnosyltransferase EarP [Parashewanella spongiae]
MKNDKSDHWDIFCTVIDNYGDIGVTWRLAKQLHKEFNKNIHLWVDDLTSFGHILPLLDRSLPHQICSGIHIHKWNDQTTQQWVAGEVIIEGFACELPMIIISEMAKQTQQSPLWLNLEYLTAEEWVDNCHALPSTHHLGVNKHFYFPGFSPKTGGLICEKNLLTERALWQQDKSAQQQFLDELNIKIDINSNTQLISIFSYESPALTALCERWVSGKKQTHALVPMGKSLLSILPVFSTDIDTITAGMSLEKGNLTLHTLPMTDQKGYDKLLWTCDINIVRGEDSFLRAQWAAKPFIWHIYPQDENVHIKKLNAFTDRYCEDLDEEYAVTIRKLNLSFNQDNADLTAENWDKLQKQQPHVLEHAKKWPKKALNGSDLATRLVNFAKNR